MASGLILHRKDNLVVNGKFKWVVSMWTFRDSALILTAQEPTQHEETFEIRADTEYKKIKSKHYPMQFGKDVVHTAVVLQKVVNVPTGYAPSPLDPLTRPGVTDVTAVCKLGALEVSELEKVLLCVQAVKEGKNPSSYLKS